MTVSLVDYQVLTSPDNRGMLYILCTITFIAEIVALVVLYKEYR